MQSFAVWCRKNDPRKDSQYTLDLHVNLWDLTYESPYIDFGIKIKNFRDLDQICVQIPFYITKSEIEDLSIKLKKESIAYLVFNDDCKVISDRHFIKIQLSPESSDNHLLLYVLEDNNYIILNNQDGSETYIYFSFQNIINNAKYKECNNIYIRFRINSEKIKDELFCRIKDKNIYFESAIIKHDILDFKINKIRNISEGSIDRFRTEQYELASFNKIHLLVMESSEKEISLYSSPFHECRRLENGWIEYLREGKQTKTKKCHDIIAYHWKKSPESENGTIKEYSNMIKISGSVSSWRIITIYVIIVLIIGISGSLIANFINSLFPQKVDIYHQTVEISSEASSEENP